MCCNKEAELTMAAAAAAAWELLTLLLPLPPLPIFDISPCTGLCGVGGVGIEGPLEVIIAGVGVEHGVCVGDIPMGGGLGMACDILCSISCSC